MYKRQSHITVPQVGGMYAGDQSRKQTLVDYGFRLPSAKDNRPLSFEEFESKLDQVMFVSATPGQYEYDHELLRAEQIIRPTGLLDPKVEVRPIEGQIDDLIGEVNKEVSKKHKILITTLTKRMAEDLTEYMKEVGIRVRYLHSCLLYTSYPYTYECDPGIQPDAWKETDRSQTSGLSEKDRAVRKYAFIDH